MSELVKRIVLSKWWIGDTVYRKCDGERGLVAGVEFRTDREVPCYYVIFADRQGESCMKMELTNDQFFNVQVKGDDKT